MMKNFKRLIIMGLIVSMFLVFNSCTDNASGGTKEDTKETSADTETKVEPDKVYKVGILSGLDYMLDTAEGFKENMKAAGYVEGKNVTYDLQKINMDMAAANTILKKFVDDKVDLIFTYPTETVLEAQKVTAGTNIPVVFSVCNIEGTTLVKDVREPGGNITGVRYPGPDLALKRFEIMQQLAPKAKKYLVPYHKEAPVCGPQLEALKPVAKEAGIELIEAPATGAEDLKAILDKQKPENIDAILFLAEPLTVTPDAFLVVGKYAKDNKKPIGGAMMDIDGYSVLFGLNIDLKFTGKSAATIADKILKGTPAAKVPVITDNSFLEINYKYAQEMGFEISDDLIGQADKVIK